MKNKRLWIALKIVVSALFLLIVVHQIGGLSALGSTLSQITWGWIALAAFAALAHILLSGLNIWLLISATKRGIPLPHFLELYVYSYCFSLVMPGQTGDLTLTLFLKKHGVPLSISTAAYFADKLITLIFMLLVGAYGFQILMPNIPSYLLVLFGAVCVAGGFSALTFINRYRWKGALFKRIQELGQRFSASLSIIVSAKRIVAFNLLITTINWGLVGLSYYLVFRALGAEVPWPMVGVIPIMSTFVGYIPISIAGVGTVEYSAIYLFSLIGAAQATVLGVYLIQRAMQFVLVALLLLQFFALKRLVFVRAER